MISKVVCCGFALEATTFLDRCHFFTSSERALAAFETGVRIMQKELNRARHGKYIKADYDRVDFLSKKIIDFIRVKEREEMVALMSKFSDHEMIFQQLIDQRFILKKPFKQI